MAIVYGLTDQGLVIKNRLVIRADINAALRVVFGNSINLGDRSILGVLVGIMSDRLGELWELIETVAASQDPNKATKSLLDAISLITGTFRPEAASSVVVLTLVGLNGTIVPDASEFATGSTAQNFASDGDVTLSLAPVWTGSTAYALGAQVSNSGNVYQAIQAGTSLSVGGPSGFASSISDGSVLWKFLGVGLATTTVIANSITKGPIVATAGDINQIVNSISGLNTVINLSDATLGRLDAEDPELRTLRVSELGTAGSGPFDALRAHLSEVLGVVSVDLFANNTDTTNADGVPPHSVEALVRGGVDQDIWDALLANVTAGIGTYASPGAGARVGTATDSAGTLHAESFSRPVDVPVYVAVKVEFDATLYPTDGDSQIVNAIVNYGATQSTGRDIVPAAISAQAFKVQGVNDVLSIAVYTDVIGTPSVWAPLSNYHSATGIRSVVSNDGGRLYICTTTGVSAASGGPTGTGTNIIDGTVVWDCLEARIVVTSRQLAEYSIANVTVTSVAGTP